jgi:hypothetical protein
MTVGLGLAAYLDVPTYLRAPHGQETASLLGMNTTHRRQYPGGRHDESASGGLDRLGGGLRLDPRRADVGSGDHHWQRRWHARHPRRARHGLCPCRRRQH